MHTIQTQTVPHQQPPSLELFFSELLLDRQTKLVQQNIVRTTKSSGHCSRLVPAMEEKRKGKHFFLPPLIKMEVKLDGEGQSQPWEAMR